MEMDSILQNRRFSPRHIRVSGTGTKIIGLQPGAQYNVSVSAASDQGRGPVKSELFWTEVGGA